jgi:hypothetical protein
MDLILWRHAETADDADDTVVVLLTLRAPDNIQLAVRN